MSVSEQLNESLQNLRNSIPEIRGSLVASTDGLAIAHQLSEGDPARLAAMVATALGLGKRMANDLQGGDFQETSISGSSASIYIYSAGGRGVLAVIAPTGSNVGLIHLEARATANAIQNVIN